MKTRRFAILSRTKKHRCSQVGKLNHKKAFSRLGTPTTELHTLIFAPKNIIHLGPEMETMRIDDLRSNRLLSGQQQHCFVSDRLFLFVVPDAAGKSAKMEYTVAPSKPGENQWVFLRL